MKKIISFILTFAILLSLSVNVYAAGSNSKIILLEAKYEILEPLSSLESDATVAEVPLFKFLKGNKYGIIDEKGKIIFAANYDDIRDYNGGIVTVIKDKKVGYVNNAGKKITTLKYDLNGTGNFSGGLAYVSVKGKYGFINTSGKEVITLKYSNALSFVGGVAPVSVGSKWGLVDNKGTVILSPKYAQIGYLDEESGLYVTFVDGIAPVKSTGGKWGYIDKSGKEIVKPQFDKAYVSRDGFAPFVQGGKMGLVSAKGIVLKATYDDIYDFGKSGITFTVLNKKIGLISNKMKVVSKAQYDYASDITPDGYITVKKSKKYGAIDKTGKEIIKLQYDWMGPFYNGLAPVVIKGKIGFINTKNKLVIPAQFDNKDAFYANFKTGSAVVIKNGKYGIINTKGEYLVKATYSKIKRDYYTGLYVASLNNKYGVFDKAGKVLLKCDYSSISTTSIAICANKGDYGQLFDLTGKLLTSGSYQDLYFINGLSDTCLVYSFEKGVDVIADGDADVNVNVDGMSGLIIYKK